ncbi:MAG TPA: acyl-CoA dehydrogenase [Dehalococcoidia bacterium]|nr:acyl-CoA dehydrogenase [Dehalococcoidia bacterium]
MATEAPTRVPVPEPDLTPQQMIARATAMRDVLREDQEPAEKRGFYSEALHEAFTKAGFYRMLQPRMFGGYEFDLPTYYRIAIEVGRGGSGGIAWCLDLAHHHSIIIGSFWPEEAQREIFGPEGHFVAGARAGGDATAKAVDGGYVINGRFRYSSGSPYSTHHLVHVRIEGGHPDGPPDGALCWACVPRDQYEIVYDWGNFNDLGLQASGSNTVLMKDACIPKHWLVIDNFRDYDQSNGTPGTRLHNNPMYLGVHGDMYHAGLVAPQVGAVRAALDEFEDILRTHRVFMGPPALQMETTSYQTSYGLATALLEAAEMILLRSGEMHMEYCRRWADTGTPFSPEDDVRQFAALQQAGILAWRAMEEIWNAAPVDAAKAGARLARYYRDVSMYRMHISARPIALAPRLAQLHFGIAAPGRATPQPPESFG